MKSILVLLLVYVGYVSSSLIDVSSKKDEIVSIEDEAFVENLTYDDYEGICGQILFRMKHFKSFSIPESSWKFKLILGRIDEYPRLKIAFLPQLLQMFSRIRGEEIKFIELAKSDNWKTYSDISYGIELKDALRITAAATEMISDQDALVKNYNSVLRPKFEAELYASGICAGALLNNDVNDDDIPEGGYIYKEFNVDSFKSSFEIIPNGNQNNDNTIYELNKKVIKKNGLGPEFLDINKFRFGEMEAVPIERINSYHEMWRNSFCIVSYLRGNLPKCQVIMGSGLSMGVLRAFIARPDLFDSLRLAMFSKEAFKTFFKMADAAGILDNEIVYRWFDNNRNYCSLTSLLSRNPQEFETVLGQVFSGSKKFQLEVIFEYLYLQKNLDRFNDYLGVFLEMFAIHLKPRIYFDLKTIQLSKLLSLINENCFVPFFFFKLTTIHGFKFDDDEIGLFRCLRDDKFRNLMNQYKIGKENQLLMRNLTGMLYMVKNEADLERIAEFFGISKNEIFVKFLIYFEGLRSTTNPALMKASFWPILQAIFKDNPLTALRVFPVDYLNILIVQQQVYLSKSFKKLVNMPHSAFMGTLHHFCKRLNMRQLTLIPIEPDDQSDPDLVWNVFYLTHFYDYPLTISTTGVYELKMCPFILETNAKLRIPCRFCGLLVESLPQSEQTSILFRWRSSRQRLNKYFCPNCANLIAHNH